MNNQNSAGDRKAITVVLSFLKNLHASGKQRVSSAELSEAVKVDSATIRRDFHTLVRLEKRIRI